MPRAEEGSTELSTILRGIRSMREDDADSFDGCKEGRQTVGCHGGGRKGIAVFGFDLHIRSSHSIIPWRTTRTMMVDGMTMGKRKRFRWRALVASSVGEVIVRSNFVVRHHGIIVECRHCLLMDIVMADGRSSDAGRRGRSRGGGKRSCKIGKKKLWAVYLDEERIIIVSMSEELGGG